MEDDIIKPLIRPMVRDLTPYRSARDEFEDFEAQKIFLDANENPFESEANRYPDPLQRRLKKALAEVKGVSHDQILLGNGSDEVLDLIFRAFCEPGLDEVILLPPTYGMYKVLAQLNNIKAHTVPLNADFELDLEAITAKIDEKTKVIFVCSPNNPSGNSIPLDQIEALLNRFKGLVVVDEAYVDFSGQTTAISLLKTYPKLMVCQTFSKAYGLAGIRLGIGFADPSIIGYLNKIKPPYNINILTQRAAMTALTQKELIELQVRELIAERQKMEKTLLKFNFVKKIFPSDANFLLVQVDDATKRYKQFIENDIVVRNRSSLTGCENSLRVTIGTPQENINFINVCKIID